MLDVLLVEDDDDVRKTITTSLQDAGHRVTEASDGAGATALLASQVFDVAIYDVNLPKASGLSLARRSRSVAPGMAVIVMSADASVADAVMSIRGGAVDYVKKPFDPDEFAAQVIGPIAERRALRKELDEARARWVMTRLGVKIVAASRPMRSLVDRLATIAQSDASVLLDGERGTGKRTLARLVHEESPRRLGPLFVIPCGALTDALAEDDARHGGDGPTRAAILRDGEGGTLVLDGVDRLSLPAQERLARLLGEPASAPRRGPDWQPRGVRVVATAEADLAERVRAGTFLDTLFFRIAAARSTVPPLRERRGDMVPLVAAILASLAPTWTQPPSVEPSARDALEAYDFPGNVAELTWALKYALLMADSHPIEAAHLPNRIAAAAVCAD